MNTFLAFLFIPMLVVISWKQLFKQIIPRMNAQCQKKMVTGVWIRAYTVTGFIFVLYSIFLFYTTRRLVTNDVGFVYTLTFLGIHQMIQLGACYEAISHTNKVNQIKPDELHLPYQLLR